MSKHLYLQRFGFFVYLPCFCGHTVTILLRTYRATKQRRMMIIRIHRTEGTNAIICRFICKPQSSIKPFETMKRTRVT